MKDEINFLKMLWYMNNGLLSIEQRCVEVEDDTVAWLQDSSAVLSPG